MNSISLLEQLGLKEREAEVYLALLELGEAPVQTIAAKARMQRPNCYAVLESLINLGLVSYHTKPGARRYIAEDPAKLQTMLRQKEELLTASLPGLRSLFNLAPNKPQVRFYEGLSGIKTLYDEILQSKKIDDVWSPEVLGPIVGQDYMEGFAERVAKNGVVLREIVTGRVVPSYQRGIYKAPAQQVRYYSSEKPAETDLLLYENKAALISYRPDVHALVIEGSGIVQTLQLMFEGMWKLAEEKK